MLRPFRCTLALLPSCRRLCRRMHKADTMEQWLTQGGVCEPLAMALIQTMLVPAL